MTDYVANYRRHWAKFRQDQDITQERYDRFIRFLKMEGQTNSECRLLIYVVKEKRWSMTEVNGLCEDRDGRHKDMPWWVWIAHEWQEHVGEDWKEFPDYIEEDWL